MPPHPAIMVFIQIYNTHDCIKHTLWAVIFVLYIFQFVLPSQNKSKGFLNVRSFDKNIKFLRVTTAQCSINTRELLNSFAQKFSSDRYSISCPYRGLHQIRIIFVVQRNNTIILELLDTAKLN